MMGHRFDTNVAIVMDAARGIETAIRSGRDDPVVDVQRAGPTPQLWTSIHVGAQVQSSVRWQLPSSAAHAENGLRRGFDRSELVTITGLET